MVCSAQVRSNCNSWPTQRRFALFKLWTFTTPIVTRYAFGAGALFGLGPVRDPVWLLVPFCGIGIV